MLLGFGQGEGATLKSQLQETIRRMLATTEARLTH